MLLGRAVATLFLLAFSLRAFAETGDYQSWLEESFAGDGPGATALLARDGKVVFRGAVGQANLELGVAMRPDHVLRIGSITKQFTAAAILRLAESGRLDVDEDITMYLPDFDTKRQHVTIEHLLTHTSGVFNYTDLPGYWRGDLIRADVSVQELIDLFAAKPWRFAPGSEFSYSNSGYALLGAIIERVSGKSYAEFLRTEFFEPLGMADTQYGGPQVVPRRASGYAVDPDGRYWNAHPISMTHPYASGALLSTVDDLARWNDALFGGRVLNEQSVRAMTTAAALDDGSAIDYGYGLYVRERDGLRVISHSGGIHGFSTSALWLPDERIYAVVLSNLENTSAANELVWRLATDAVATGASSQKR